MNYKKTQYTSNEKQKEKMRNRKGDNEGMI